MTDQPLNTSPNEILARTVVQKLVQANCIREVDRAKVYAAMSNGKVSEQDWNLWAERVLDASEVKCAD